MVFIFRSLIAEERKLVSVIPFGNIRHLKAADAFLPVKLDRKQVQNVLNVANAVHMSVDIDIAVFRRQHCLRLFSGNLNARRLLYRTDRKSTRLNSSHANISYAVFCLKKNLSPATTYLSLASCFS